MQTVIVALALAGLVVTTSAQDTTGACAGIDCKNGNCRNLDANNFRCDCFPNTNWIGQFCDRLNEPCKAWGCSAAQCETVGTNCQCKAGWTGARCLTAVTATLTIAPSQATYAQGSTVTFTCSTNAAGTTYAFTLLKGGVNDGTKGSLSSSTTWNKVLSQVGAFTYKCRAVISGTSVVTRDSTPLTFSVIGGVQPSPCPPNKCQNGGQCNILYGNKGVCNCRNTGHSGENCEIPHEGLCDNIDCINGGRCRPNNGNPICECRPGFTGFVCQDATDRCQIGCNNGQCGQVTNVGGKQVKVCVCNQGWTGDYCTTAVTNVCNGVSCNQGTCSVNNGQAQCRCNTGYSGDRCQYLTTLTVTPTSVSVGGSVTFQCTTTIPLTGPYTFNLFKTSSGSAVTSSTQSNPTWTGNQNINSDTTFYCTVTSGSGSISGQTLQKTVTVGDSVGSNPCANYVTVTTDCKYGHCEVQGVVARCVCEAGWWGPNCDRRDVCLFRQSFCQNGGVCTPQVANPGFSCRCGRGYTGNFCQFVNRDAPCSTDRDCVGTQGCGNTERGYCKIPEMVCKCTSDEAPPCKDHYQCNQQCKSKYGLCMKNERCRCFENEGQMTFFAIVYNFPSSPPFVAP